MNKILTAPLTKQQQRVTQLVCEGLTYPTIAAAIGCSIRTVRAHVEAAANKMPKKYLTPQARILDWYLSE